MKKQHHLKRPLAVLLALVMMMTLAPAALAETLQCPKCHLYTYERTVVFEANCHEAGLIKYLCSSCKYGTVEDIPIDKYNHDIVYSDNGNGTHSGVCRYHADATTSPAPHKYTSNGICELCGVSNYSAAAMDLPSERTVPVALGDTSAKLSAGDVRITLGTSNITEDYTLSYLWYQDGRQVGEGNEYQLPASVYGKEGTCYFILIVNAQPKSGASRAPLSQTCRITVKVAELISAAAVVTKDDGTLRLGSSTVWTAEPVSNQIYDGVQRICGLSAEPASVVFTDVPASNVGRLDAGTSPYTFSTGSRKLEDVTFTAGDATGDFVAGFTAYDSAGKSYAGVLTITVQQYAADMDVVCVAPRDAALSLSAADFTAFWQSRFPGGELEYISFDRLPRSVEGTLYVDYNSAFNSDTVRINDEFYVTPTVRQYGISSVTFVPSVGVKQQNYITLPFTACGLRSSGRSSERTGYLYIFFTDDLKTADISVTVPGTGLAGSTGTALNPAAFHSVYEKMTGAAGSFYIQLLGVPASGALYLNRTAASNGIRLTSENVAGRPFSYGGSTSETIADLTYVPGAASSESIRYVASSAQGKPLFAGNINFTSSAAPTTVTGLVVDYASPATGVTFRGSDFVNAQGAGQPTLASVCFTPPTALYGTLYYGRSAVNAGTAITTGTNWFSTASSTIAGSNYVDGVSFVPALSYTSGTVAIPFTALTSAGTRVSGTVRVTVGTGTGTNPGGSSTDPANNGTTAPGTTTPTVPANAKTFKDVPQSAYYYPYVTALTTTGVLSGYEDGTFRPDSTVNLGEALKMIMTSVGYPEQAATTKEWASGYLALAKSEGLLPDGTIETLSRPVDRYTIAGIAARAMRLQMPAVAVSPFADMEAGHAAAPAVSALQKIGVLIGNNKNGQLVYQGAYAIKRCDFAIIIWRMQNYARTGNVNGMQ